MYNIKHNNLRKPMKDMFEISNNESHNLRSNAVDFHIPKPKTNFIKKKYQLLGGFTIEQLANGSKATGDNDQ